MRTHTLSLLPLLLRLTLLVGCGQQAAPDQPDGAHPDLSQPAANDDLSDPTSGDMSVADDLSHNVASDLAQAASDLAHHTDMAQHPVDMAQPPACFAPLHTCSIPSQCCSGYTCGHTSAGQVCCGNAGATCHTTDGRDCCGDLECVSGKCVAPDQKILTVDYQVQQTSYWCGPTATRCAISARIMPPPTQQQLANEMGTTTNGTDWIGIVTTALNNHLGANRYRTVEMPNDPPTAAQKSALWNDLLFSVDHGYAIVANIVAPPSNHPPGYPNNETIYHYIALIGYKKSTQEVYVADSADFSGYKEYWLSLSQMSTLIPPKGYSTLNTP